MLMRATAIAFVSNDPQKEQLAGNTNIEYGTGQNGLGKHSGSANQNQAETGEFQNPPIIKTAPASEHAKEGSYNPALATKKSTTNRTTKTVSGQTESPKGRQNKNDNGNNTINKNQVSPVDNGPAKKDPVIIPEDVKELLSQRKEEGEKEESNSGRLVPPTANRTNSDLTPAKKEE